MTVDYRLARANDGPAIGKLMNEAGDYGVDWSTVDPSNWWIVAERDGDVVGAVQVIMSRPYGYIGEIIVRPDERGKSNGTGRLGYPDVALHLYSLAIHLLAANGSQLAFAHVERDNMGIQAYLRRHDWHVVGELTLMAKRL